MATNGPKTATLTTASPLAEIYGQYPMELDRGEGLYVYDTQGRRYLDLYGGHAVSLLGHSPADVVEAIAEQGRKFMFYSNLARIPIRAEGAARLLAFGRFDRHQVFFCNSGGEANENALKIAIKLTGRSKVIAFDGAFHGRTLLAAGATDHPEWRAYLRGWMGPVDRLAPNDPAGLRRIDAGTAAVILEPIQSIGGVTGFDYDFLQALREKCDEVGAFLIYDEVQTGMGRLGTPFVSTECGAPPDMTSLAKGIAAGFAMGAVIMTEAVGARLVKGDIAATFGGGPMAVAAMIATIDRIERDDLIASARAFERALRESFKSEPCVREIRGRGCLMGLVLDRPAAPIFRALFAEGIIAGLNSDANLLHLLPPLTAGAAEVETLRSALRKVVQT
jgi:acetylornithine/succinyldiaminopimelate/putrescine aminotransferase